MDKKDTQEFFRWLKENGIFQLWIKNRTLSKKYWRRLNRISERQKFISGAFPWMRTNEGYDFWTYVHYLWLAHENKYISNGDLHYLSVLRSRTPIIQKYFKTNL